MDRLYIVRMTAMIAIDTSVICVLLKISTHAILKTFRDNIYLTFNLFLNFVRKKSERFP